jgi:hypothetical protein
MEPVVTQSPIHVIEGGLAPGKHVFSLVVVDDEGQQSEPDEVVVMVIRDTKIPVANAGKDKEGDSAVLEGSSVTLDGSGSRDPDGGEITRYIWTHVSGPSTLNKPIFSPSIGAAGLGIFRR